MHLVFLFLCLVLFATPSMAQVVFSGTIIPFQDDIYSGVEDALEDHHGDFIILYYHKHDDLGARIASCMFRTEESVAYLKENFELIAVEIGSSEWQRLQRTHRPNAKEVDWPHIVIDVRRFLAHVEFHGWENCDSGRVLDNLIAMKEEGPEAVFEKLNE